jgi:hypothetical protein
MRIITALSPTLVHQNPQIGESILPHPQRDALFVAIIVTPVLHMSNILLPLWIFLPPRVKPWLDAIRLYETVFCISDGGNL